MKETKRTFFSGGTASIMGFILWTVLIRCVDVQPIGPEGSCVGFAGINAWFHRLTGIHMVIYSATDWLGLVPILICMGFGCLGLMQWIRRRHLLRVDRDILLLGIYYGIVIAAYLLFEKIPVNYRPVLIEGRLEASYPSSTTLLVLSVMPTLTFQSQRRISSRRVRQIAAVSSTCFAVFMVVGRMTSGVHWLTDIVGAALLSSGLFSLYVRSTQWNSTKNCRN